MLETVLLVDDQDDVRNLLAEVLRLGAYRVLEAKNGVQALKLAEAHPNPIGLLVTDIVMPGITGVQLAEALRARNANLKVLFMSGYAERDSLRVLATPRAIHPQAVPTGRALPTRERLSARLRAIASARFKSPADSAEARRSKACHRRKLHRNRVYPVEHPILLNLLATTCQILSGN